MIGIAKELISLGSTWIRGKQQKEQAKAEAEAQVMKTSATSRAEWERVMAQGAANSWKDEYWTVVLSLPAILCFIPGGTEIAKDGFQALSNMPDYYQYFLGLAITASYGVKGFKQWRAK